ncbi:hypothetical protein [Acinetobacter guillouiae]|uniref:hypothetical protein n=1 Tax=Acinetobacter guillouiae TaxID=106649 RepID=UPI0033426AD3
MSSTVIRDFLVALTFKTDDTGAKKSKEALDSNEKSANLLSRALIALASTAVLAVAKTANELEKLYYSSQRIGASANNIRAYGDAISQMGGSAEGAISSLESVARKLRESPGYEGMLKGLGVTTRDQNGQMRDRVEVMKDLSKTLQGMEYYKANNYANALGIDESTLMAMRDGKFTSEMEKYQKLRKDMGLNDELAKSGQEFAYQWRDMTMQLKALMEVIVMTAGKALIPVLKLLNQLIQFAIHWFGQLNPHIKTFLAAGLKIAMLTVVFGGLFSAIGKFAKLLPMLTGLLNIFKALRLVFLASPIGIVLALAAAIALLWDDYQTWKRGGESLLDWEKWAGGIETAISKIKELGNTLKDLQQKATDFILGKKIGDETLGIKLGRTVAKGLAFIGNKEAQAALDAEKASTGNTKQQSTQTLQQTALAGVNRIVGMANAVAGDVQEKVQANSSLKLGNKSDNRMMVYEAFLNAGLSKNQALAITAEVGRENEYNAKTMFGFHTDAAKDGKGNSISNMGFLSWNRERATKLKNYLQQKGLLDEKGKIVQGQAALNAMAEFAVSEMKDDKYASKLPKFWNNPNFDPETFAAELGKIYVGWAYGQETIKGPNGTRIKFDWQPHDQRRRNNLNALENDLSKKAISNVEINRGSIAKFAQNAEVPNNINPVIPNISNTQSSNRNVNINQKTDIHVTGGDAMMTAKAVRKEQDAVNLQMTRNSKGLWG